MSEPSKPQTVRTEPATVDGRLHIQIALQFNSQIELFGRAVVPILSHALTLLFSKNNDKCQQSEFD
jgi:hypothetical protein